MMFTLGDPTLGGWVVTFGYLFCAFFSLRKYREEASFNQAAVHLLILTLLLFCLGINKQLDLQTFFFTAMKTLAKSHGWYEQRGMMQGAFVVIIGIGLLSSLLMARAFLIRSWSKNKPIWLGLMLLFVFIFLRAAAFNKFRYISEQSVLGFNLYAVLELSAIVLIGFGVSRYSGESRLIAEQAVIYDEGAEVSCPRCGKAAVARAAQGRKFKCKECFYKYEINVRPA